MAKKQFSQADRVPRPLTSSVRQHDTHPRNSARSIRDTWSCEGCMRFTASRDTQGSCRRSLPVVSLAAGHGQYCGGCRREQRANRQCVSRCSEGKLLGQRHRRVGARPHAKARQRCSSRGGASAAGQVAATYIGFLARRSVASLCRSLQAWEV